MNPLLTRIIYILLILSFVNIPETFSQQKEKDTIYIKGVVLSINNQAVRDVSISIEGELGELILTDSAGEFSIKTTPGIKWMAFSSLEHIDKRVLLEDQTYIKIYLAPNNLPSNRKLIPYFNTEEEKRNIIMPVEHLAAIEDKYRKPYATTGDYLQGRVSGLLATNNSALPGSGSYLMLRGMRSLYSTNQPLIFIDGMPLETPGSFAIRTEGFEHNAFNSINPMDISDITILKDAGTTAMYGVNGANGVVNINTLVPSATRTTIDFMLRTGITTMPRQMPQLNSAHYKNLANEVLSTSGIFEEEYEAIYPGLFLAPGDRGYLPYSHDTNWQDQIFSAGIMNEVHFLVKGGDEISRYGLSVGYLNKEGVIKSTDYTRYTTRFTSFLRVYPWLEMNINANLNSNSSSLMPSAINHQINPILSSFFKPPLLFPYNYDDNGNLLQTIADIREFDVSNPLAIVERSNSQNSGNQFITSINLKAQINKNFIWNSLLGLNLNSLKEEMFRPGIGMAEYFEGLAYSYSERNTNRYSSLYSNHSLIYSHEFNYIHRVTSSVGLRLHTNNIEHDWARANNLPLNDEFSDLQSGDSRLQELGGFSGRWNRTASYANFNYIFKDKYITSASGSLEFSSRNGKENEKLLKVVTNMPLGYFYSVGAGWRVSGERFLSNASWLENLLIRSSFGVAGNDDIGNYNALDYHQQVRYRETTGLIPGTIHNTSLKHEDSRQFNVGVDLSFFGEKISIKMDYFTNKTSDLFFYEPQPAYIGYLRRPSNYGEIFNKGIEASAYLRLIQTENFHWDVHGNVTWLNNKVLNLREDIIASFQGGRFINRVGEKTASFYGYDYLGVYSTHEQAATHNLVNERGVAYGAGDAIYRDISGPNNAPDGVIDKYDMIILGSPLPDYFGNLQNRFMFKNLLFEFTFYFVSGNNVFNYLRFQNEKMSDLSNQSISTLRRWQKEGDQTDIPRSLWNDPLGNTSFSSRWIEDGSYLRLKDATLRYRIPKQFLVFTDAEFFLSGINLFTLTKYLGYDPEFSHSYNPLEQGIDYGLMPQTRQFIIGIKMGL
jgi:TonB-linked SusC/RagA family outer membrane protein